MINKDLGPNFVLFVTALMLVLMDQLHCVRAGVCSRSMRKLDFDKDSLRKSYGQGQGCDRAGPRLELQISESGGDQIREVVETRPARSQSIFPVTEKVISR